jgi:hypothetical protein
MDYGKISYPDICGTGVTLIDKNPKSIIL